MNFVGALAFVGCIAMAVGAGLSEEHLEKMKQAKKECIEETGISEEAVAKAEKGVFDDDAKLPEFFFCFLKKPGFLNEAGEYQIETMTTKLSENYGEEAAHNVITECTKENHGNGHENALHLAKCCQRILKDKQ